MLIVPAEAVLVTDGYMRCKVNGRPSRTCAKLYMKPQVFSKEDADYIRASVEHRIGDHYK